MKAESKVNESEIRSISDLQKNCWNLTTVPFAFKLRHIPVRYHPHTQFSGHFPHETGYPLRFFSFFLDKEMV